jgi:PAS domain S-box-containing protein
LGGEGKYSLELLWSEETSVTKEIRILYVEDLPADAVLVNHELRKGGLRFRTKRVDTRDIFVRELNENPPDLILSDHGLPTFDGFVALAIAKKKCPNVPFIFVTNSQGEEMAIETFESGATDYVLKQNLGKLVPAVQRALREAEERTRLQQKEQALRESEERFRMLVEGVKDYAIFMLDPKGRVTSWNTGAEWLHGYRAKEILGRSFSMFYASQDVEHGQPILALKTAADEGRFHEEGVRLAKGGHRFWADVAITALRDPSGKLRGFAQVTRNITQRKETEERLSGSEALKTAILNAALDAIISINHEGLVQEWNPAAEKMFGYAREEALGRLVDDLIVPALLSEVYNGSLANYFLNGAVSLMGRPIELKLRRANGEEFSAEMAISRIPTEDPPRCTALIRDITERKLAEVELRESEERFRLLVDGVKEYAIYMLNTNGDVATWNEGAERLEGYKAQEIIGKSFSIFFPPEAVQRKAPEAALKRAEREGRARNEGWRVRKDGSRFWSLGIITALRDENGKLRGFAKVAYDMTKKKEAEDEIRRLNAELESRVIERTAQLEAANQELEAFSYSVSHDLRAPLRHILGYVDILRTEADDSLNPTSRHHLQTIAESATQMGQLIDALLEFSRMGRTEIRFEWVDVARLVEEARRELRDDIQGRDIEWKIGELPAVRGDPLMLRQVIVNLLANALKYTRTRAKAKIGITSKNGGREITFCIEDNGVGFDMTYADKLFGVFQRFHRSSDFEGTGIGLANVRRIIHRHGGRTWAIGKVDKGATICFSIPKQPTEAK